MKREDLNTKRIKQLLGAERVRKIYENKHVDGSGNLGIVIVKNDLWYRIDARYNAEKEIYELNYGDYGFGGEWKELKNKTFDCLIAGLQLLIDKKEFALRII